MSTFLDKTTLQREWTLALMSLRVQKWILKLSLIDLYVKMCLPQNFQEGHYAKVNPDKTNYLNRARCCNVIFLAKWVNHCSTIRATRVRFTVEVISSDLRISSRCWANSALHPSEAVKWISGKTRANKSGHPWWGSRPSTTVGGITVRKAPTLPGR